MDNGDFKNMLKLYKMCKFIFVFMYSIKIFKWFLIFIKGWKESYGNDLYIGNG